MGDAAHLRDGPVPVRRACPMGRCGDRTARRCVEHLRCGANLHGEYA